MTDSQRVKYTHKSSKTQAPGKVVVLPNIDPKLRLLGVQGTTRLLVTMVSPQCQFESKHLKRSKHLEHSNGKQLEGVKPDYIPTMTFSQNSYF